VFAQKNAGSDIAIENDVAKQNFQAANATFEPDFNSTVNSNLPEENEVSNANVSGQKDADGLPWDERIHSSNKKIKADGRWTTRRNVDPATHAAVLAELRGQPQAVFNIAPMVQPAYNPAPAAVQPAYNPMATQPVQPAYNPAPAAAPVQDFTALFNTVQSLFQQGRADLPWLTSLTTRLSQQFGVQVGAINDIAPRSDMIAAAFQMIAQDGKA
jgi:hypothetical protein